MFIESFQNFRATLFDTATITTLVQLEYNAFEPACVPVAVFTAHKHLSQLYKGTFIRLSDFTGPQNQPIKTLEAIGNPQCGWLFESSTKAFGNIPGEPVAYWASQQVLDTFSRLRPLSEYGDAKHGMSTSDNNRFLRLWYEVSLSNIGFGMQSRKEAQNSECKWFPYNKGGPFLKWYGNNMFIVNWKNDGEEIREESNRKYPYLKGKLDFVLGGQKYFFQRGITWSSVTSGLPSMRLVDHGFIFDTTGQCFFSFNGNNTQNVLGYLNSSVAADFLSVLSPTLHFNCGQIAVLPFPGHPGEGSANPDVDAIRRCLELAQETWNDSEMSWEFEMPRLLRLDPKRPTLAESVQWVLEYEVSRSKELREKERKNDDTWRSIFEWKSSQDRSEEADGVQGAEARVAIVVKSLFSFAIGCMMGRYSLDKPGFIYAHSCGKGFDPDQYRTFPADEDGIIPLTEFQWFEDDAANRLENFIATAWPKVHLEDNLKFVADSLGPNRVERSLETIRRYLATGFYKDHLRTYKGPKHPPRPIYWLFSSGKQRAFQCLVYLHRYHEGALARMRTEYVIPLQGKIAARVEQLEGDKNKATSTSHRKKLQKEQDDLKKKQAELFAFDEKLKHAADQKITLDLDDGVKVNYAKFGDLLAEVKAVCGGKEEE